MGHTIHDHELVMRWPAWSESWWENYDYHILEKIKNKGWEWLNTLPMLEYAYTLVIVAMEKYGGKPLPYVNDLFANRMVPILASYDKRLLQYRVNKAILARRYASMQKYVNESTIGDQKREMIEFTKKTRHCLKAAVEQWIDFQRRHIEQSPIERLLPENYGNS